MVDTNVDTNDLFDMRIFQGNPPQSLKIGIRSDMGLHLYEENPKLQLTALIEVSLPIQIPLFHLS